MAYVESRSGYWRSFVPTVVVDGPEKAGKTTLIQQIGQAWCRRLGVGSIARARRWGPVKSDLEYLPALQADMTAHERELVIWDRSWASESVYGLLLNREGRRLAIDPWLGEWLYGRAVQTLGLRVMVSRSPEVRASLRDKTDLPVDPWLEGYTFDQYGRDGGWYEARNNEGLDHWISVAEEIVDLALANYLGTRALPPTYCGVVGARIVVVGERRNEESGFPGAWLPLTTPLTTQLGRALGRQALDLGWMNAHDGPPAIAREANVLVALGEKAFTWAKFHVGHPNIVELPHPAWLYRFGSARERISQVEDQLKAVVRRGTATPL